MTWRGTESHTAHAVTGIRGDEKAIRSLVAPYLMGGCSARPYSITLSADSPFSAISRFAFAMTSWCWS